MSGHCPDCGNTLCLCDFIVANAPPRRRPLAWGWLVMLVLAVAAALVSKNQAFFISAILFAFNFGIDGEKRWGGP